MIRLAALFIALSTPVAADPDRLSVLFGSAHPGARFDYEAANPGLFLTWEDRALGLDYSIGVFRNSFGGASIAGTAALPLFERGEFQASVFGGVALYPGYGDHFAVHAGDLVPMAGLQARYRDGFVQIMPGKDMAVISLGLTFPLD